MSDSYVLAEGEETSQPEETPPVFVFQDVRQVLTPLIWADADIKDPRSLELFGLEEALDAAVSPVLASMQLADGIMLMSQIGILLLVRFFATCSDSGQAVYPMWIWSVALPFAITRLLIEYKVVKSFVPAYIVTVLQVPGAVPFKLGPLVLGSLLWLFTYMSFSLSNVADLGTDSCFTGITLASLQCSGEQASSIWEKTWGQSLFGKHGIPAVDLGWIALAFWILSLFQMVVPLLSTIGFKKDGMILKSCAGDLGYPEDVCAELAEGSGMATIQSLAAPKSNAKIVAYVNKGFNKGGHELAAPLARVVALRVWLSHVLEISLQINLQITLFAINSYIVDKAWTQAQLQAVASIALSMVTASTKFAEIYSFFQIVNGTEMTIIKQNWAEKSPELVVKSFYRCVWLVRVGFAIIVLSVMYGLSKFIAVFLCADSMWNITGCVDMSQ